MSKFSERLRKLRTSRGLSQQKLADYLGASKSSINMYERGEREPGLDMLENIADFFNVDMDYLHGKTNVMNRIFENAPNVTQAQTEKPAESELPDELIKMYTIYKTLTPEHQRQMNEYLAFLLSQQDD